MTFFSTSVRLAALPLALASAWPVFAQSSAQTPARVPADILVAALGETVVTATRSPTRSDELVSDVTVIDRATIEASTARTLPELLARTAGLQFTANGGLGKNAGVFIRGTEARHTILLIDGVRYGSATAGTPTWEAVPVEMIERIEVLKGPASAIYGADAAGGVVQIFTRKGAKGLHPYASVTLGSDSFRELNAGLRGGQDNVSYALGVSQDVVVKYDAGGAFVDRIAVANRGADDEPARLRAATALAVDSRGRVYVADIFGIKVYDGDGQYVGAIDAPDVAFGLAIDDADILYIAARTEVLRYQLQ